MNFSELLFFEAKNHTSMAFHTTFSRSTHLVLRRNVKNDFVSHGLQKTLLKMLCGVQISSGMYWENPNESA